MLSVDLRCRAYALTVESQAAVLLSVRGKKSGLRLLKLRAPASQMIAFCHPFCSAATRKDLSLGLSSRYYLFPILIPEFGIGSVGSPEYPGRVVKVVFSPFVALAALMSYLQS